VPAHLIHQRMLGHLSRLVSAGLPLTDPRVVCASQRLDRLVVAVMRAGQNAPADTGGDVAQALRKTPRDTSPALVPAVAL